MGAGNNRNTKTGNHLKEDQPDLHPVLTNDGARRALNFILDVAKERKDAANFVWNSKKGTIVEATSGKEIGLTFKPKQG